MHTLTHRARKPLEGFCLSGRRLLDDADADEEEDVDDEEGEEEEDKGHDENEDEDENEEQDGPIIIFPWRSHT